MSNHNPKPAVYLVQFGARRNYELVEFLNAQTRLVQFTTSMAWLPDVKSSILRLVSRKFRPGKTQRRTVPWLGTEQFHSVPLAEATAGLCNLLCLRPMLRRAYSNWMLGRSVIRRGWYGADVLFTVDGNGGFAMLEAARKDGLLIVGDIVVTPKAYQCKQVEDRLWPELASRHLLDSQVDEFEEHYRRLASLCDLMICPSATVIDGIAEIAPGAEERCVLIPYGLGGNNVKAGTPKPGRVLFAGGEATRKGLPYLGEAAALLKEQGCNIEVLVAGAFPHNVREHSACRALTFLGHLDRIAMAEEFAQADVFCLPSLAEGSASVVLEALSAGVPAVVTRSAGSTVTDGCEGFIVPERDSESLALAIKEIVEDRELRSAMSREALALAASHGSNKIAPQIASAIANALNTARCGKNSNMVG